MTGRWWLDAAIGAAAALVVCWLLLIAALFRGNRRHGGNMAEAFRLLPDLVRLLRRVAVDRSLPVGVRVRIWGLLVYLALPIDLVPTSFRFLATPTTRSSPSSFCVASSVGLVSTGCAGTGPAPKPVSMGWLSSRASAAMRVAPPTSAGEVSSRAQDRRPRRMYDDG